MRNAVWWALTVHGLRWHFHEWAHSECGDNNLWSLAASPHKETEGPWRKIFQSHVHGADVGQRLIDCKANEASASVFLLGMRHRVFRFTLTKSARRNTWPAVDRGRLASLPCIVSHFYGVTLERQGQSCDPAKGTLAWGCMQFEI